MRSLVIIATTAVLLVIGVCSVQAQQKTIKDSAEYNAYITALNMQDPVQKAAAMEAFIEKYPNSVVILDALEQAMGAYQAGGNVDKVQSTANRILAIDQNHVQALAVMVFINRNQATSGKTQLLPEIKSQAARGLQLLPTWNKPAEMSDEDFKNLQNRMASIFNGASGFVALQAKDYAAARDYYLKSVQIDPNNLQDVYQLSIAELEMKPIDPNGFWYIAKAIKLSGDNKAAVQSISGYGKAKYHNYHGGDDGWDSILASIGDQNVPPPSFAGSIKRAPTAAEIAVQAVQQNDVSSMSFSDWEFILSYRDASPANKEAADKVWRAIQSLQKNGAAKLSIPVKVISATGDTIIAAISEDNQKSNTADVRITLQSPVASPPKPGAEIKIVGVLTDYALNPLVFTMKQAEISGS